MNRNLAQGARRAPFATRSAVDAGSNIGLDTLGWVTYWVNSKGEYIAVSDPNFDPNSLNDGFWEQLEPRG